VRPPASRTFLRTTEHLASGLSKSNGKQTDGVWPEAVMPL
jgi:hypothetical protein